jgi:hypothetical protein
MDRDSALLIGGLVVSTVAMIADEVVEHPLFKAAKIIALLASLGLAMYRIRSYMPYAILVRAHEFRQVADNEYEFSIPASRHKRGLTPTAICQVEQDGGWAEAIFGLVVNSDGTLRVQAGSPVDVKVFVRR